MSGTDDALEVEVPGYRVDIEREADLIEEIARFRGYDAVPSAVLPVAQPGGVPDGYALVDRARDALAGAGLREVRQIPFVSASDLTVSGDDPAVPVRNPLASDEGHLRTALLPGLLRTARRNLARGVRGAALFEVGAVFRLTPDGDAEERRRVGIVVTGEIDEGLAAGRAADALDAKGAVASLLRELGVAWSTGGAADLPFHPSRSAIILVDGVPVGAVGEMHPRVAARFDLPGRVAVAELDLAPLGARPALAVRDLPRFPPVRRDLAFVVDASVASGVLEGAIRAGGGDLVDEVRIFDRFVGGPLPTGKASLAYAVTFRAADRTLTDAEADDAVAAIRDRVAREVGGELRAG
ncbi:MAG: hypothetical protein ACKOI0_03635 [Actinomycetota bacterium]